MCVLNTFLLHLPPEGTAASMPPRLTMLATRNIQGRQDKAHALGAYGLAKGELTIIKWKYKQVHNDKLCEEFCEVKAGGNVKSAKGTSSRLENIEAILKWQDFEPKWEKWEDVEWWLHRCG